MQAVQNSSIEASIAQDYNAAMGMGGSQGISVAAYTQFNADGEIGRHDCFSSFVDPLTLPTSAYFKSKLKVVSNALVHKVLLEDAEGGSDSAKVKACGIALEVGGEVMQDHKKKRGFGHAFSLVQPVT